MIDNQKILFKNLNINYMINNQIILLKFIQTNNTNVDWNYISFYYTLSENFIHKFENHLNWYYIYISMPKIIRKFYPRI